MKTIGLLAGMLGLLSGLCSAGWASEEAAGPGISPAAALEKMEQGNLRFVSGKVMRPHVDAERRQLTEKHGQFPFATVIACSDSRVPVEIVFDQGIGDLFVIKVAGNVCDTDEIGSIEYGVDHLRTPLMVVMGHTRCGAVTAVATGAEVHGCIPALVDNIGPAVRKVRNANERLAGEALVSAAVKENVWQAIDDLFRGSAAVRTLVSEGRLAVVGAVYELGTGAVEWMGPHPGQAGLLSSNVSGENADRTAGMAAPAPHGGYSFEVRLTWSAVSALACMLVLGWAGRKAGIRGRPAAVQR